MEVGNGRRRGIGQTSRKGSLPDNHIIEHAENWRRNKMRAASARVPANGTVRPDRNNENFREINVLLVRFSSQEWRQHIRPVKPGKRAGRRVRYAAVLPSSQSFCQRWLNSE